VPAISFDLDKLALYLKSQIAERKLSIRAAAEKIGCSPATLTRLLQGSTSSTTPDSENLILAASWVGRPLGEFAKGMDPPVKNIADVEVHLRALPGLRAADADTLVAMVRAAYDSVRFRTSKRPAR